MNLKHQFPHLKKSPVVAAGHLQSPRPPEQRVVGRPQPAEQPGGVVRLRVAAARAEAGLHPGHGVPQGRKGKCRMHDRGVQKGTS